MRVFLYADNLNPSQLKRRAPEHKFLFKAYLPDHTIHFCRFSSQWRCGLASITPSQGERVWGVVFELTDEDLKILDTFEGEVPKARSGTLKPRWSRKTITKNWSPLTRPLPSVNFASRITTSILSSKEPRTGNCRKNVLTRGNCFAHGRSSPRTTVHALTFTQRKEWSCLSRNITSSYVPTPDRRAILNPRAEGRDLRIFS